MPILLEYRKKKRNSLTIKLKQADWTIVKEIDRKKRKERTELKKRFFVGGVGITMIEKRNYVQID